MINTLLPAPYSKIATETLIWNAFQWWFPEILWLTLSIYKIYLAYLVIYCLCLATRFLLFLHINANISGTKKIWMAEVMLRNFIASESQGKKKTKPFELDKWENQEDRNKSAMVG